MADEEGSTFEDPKNTASREILILGDTGPSTMEPMELREWLADLIKRIREESGLVAELATTRELLHDSAKRSAELETALGGLIEVCEGRQLMSFAEGVRRAAAVASSVYRGVTPEPEKRS